MNKLQFQSASREILTAIGAAVSAYGFAEDHIIAAWSGAVLAAAMVVWAVVKHSDKGVIGTLARKLISSGSGVAVAYGVATPEKIEAISALFLVGVSLAFGARKATKDEENKKGLDISKISPLLIFLAAGALLTLPSCSLTSVRLTEDGCVLAKIEGAQGDYYAGPCYGLDEDGVSRRDRYQAVWENETGDTLRATYWVDSEREVQIEYLVDDTWVRYDAKSGILFGVLPAPVQEALESSSK